MLNGDFRGSEGVFISVFGSLTTGKEVAFGNSAKLRCDYKVTIEDGVDVTEECQIFDTNFHPTQDIRTGRVKRYMAPIHIGRLSWIGNRTTITKGAVLPEYTMVCSNSLVNKDFSNVNLKCPLIGGIPAKLISGGLHRIYDTRLQLEIMQRFRSNPELTHMDIGIIDVNAADDIERRHPEDW